MDQRIEAFLADVLALAGEEPAAVREGVRDALACEAIFRAQQTNKRMRDNATFVCHTRRAVFAPSRKCINAEERRFAEH
jgi:hypothetical protein